MEIKNLHVSTILANSGYVILNKKLVKTIGLDLAYLYSELANEEKYWYDRKELTEDGYFFSTHSNIEKSVGWKRKKQWSQITKLKELGLLETEVRGMPGKRYIKLIPDELIKILDDPSCFRLET